MLLKVVMVMLVLSLGKSFLENRTVAGPGKGTGGFAAASYLGASDSGFDDFMEQEQLRLSNPYETPGVDVMIDHDYHGMSNGID